MNLAFTQPDKLGERARLAREVLDAIENDRMDDARRLEKELLAQLRFTGHLSNDPNMSAYIEWQCFEHGVVHINYGPVPPEGVPFDDAWMDDPKNDDKWLEVDPTTGVVTQL